jgi:hypothetical protein
MKIRQLLLCTVIVLLVLPSCRTNKSDQEISRIDGLISRAEGLREKLGSEEIDRWHEVYYEMEENIELIDSGYFTSVSDPAFNEALPSYREIFITLGDCIHSCIDLQKEVSYTESHLRTMREGRISGSLSDSAYQVLFRAEMELLDELTERIYTGLETVESHVNRFQKYNPTISQYREQLDVPEETNGREQ